jgi:menaquinone reductase, multiheme cytochrome c subunit
MIRGKILTLAGMAISLAAGWAGFPRAIYRRVPQPVEFSHRVHAEKAGQSCEDCHAFREDGTFAGMPSLDKCASCHAAAMGTTAAEKQFIDEYVTPQREPQWRSRSEQPENVWFPHSIHVKRGGMKCETCHGNQAALDAPQRVAIDRISGYPRTSARRGLPEPLGMNDCVSCHRKTGRELSCLDCHK